MKILLALFLTLATTLGAQTNVASKLSVIWWTNAPGFNIYQTELALTATNVTSLSTSTNLPTNTIASIRVPGSQTNLAVTNLLSNLDVMSNYLVWGRSFTTNPIYISSEWTNVPMFFVPTPKPPTLSITPPP